MHGKFLVIGALALALAACSTTSEPVVEPPPPAPVAAPAPPPPPPPTVVYNEIGTASWYGRNHHGRKTASGAPYDMHAMTAAHRTLPFNTRAKVTNLDSGRSVDVVITDRGPYKRGRVIDLSARAAEMLGIREDGVAGVRIEVFEGNLAEAPPSTVSAGNGAAPKPAMNGAAPIAPPKPAAAKPSTTTKKRK